MSDTPKTDAAIAECFQSGQHQKVKAEAMRALERELNDLRRILQESSFGKRYD